MCLFIDRDGLQNGLQEQNCTEILVYWTWSLNSLKRKALKSHLIRTISIDFDFWSSPVQLTKSNRLICEVSSFQIKGMWYLKKIESSCEQFSPVSTCLRPKYIKFCSSNLRNVIEDKNGRSWTTFDFKGMWYLRNKQILLSLGFYMFVFKVYKIFLSKFEKWYIR